MAEVTNLATHPVVGAVINLSGRSGVETRPGSYRIVNVASGKCLSYTARSSSATGAAGGNANTTPPTQTICGWRCGLPVVDDDLNQAWVIRPTPKPTISSSAPTTSTASSGNGSHLASGYTVVIEAQTISTDSNGYRQRLDLAEIIAPIVDPTIPSGRSKVPNKLPPPQGLTFSTVASPEPQPPAPAPIVQPVLSSYERTLVVSPKGTKSSSWQVYPIPSVSGRHHYVIYNPSSGLFVGHVPVNSGVASTTAGTASVPVEQVTDGMPVQAVDFHKFINDLEDWTRKTKATTFDLIQVITQEVNYLLWEVERIDWGVGAGSFRIVHDQTMLALSGTKSEPIQPFEINQVWDLQPSISNPATVTYAVTNYAIHTSLGAGFRTIWLPTESLGVPNPSPTAPSRFLLYDTAEQRFMHLHDHESSDYGSQGQNDDLDEQAALGRLIPPFENHILRMMYEDRAKFDNEYGHLVWRLLPEEWGPKDGLYTLQDPNNLFLDISPLTTSVTSSLSLSAGYPYPSVGSTVWIIKSGVDISGTIYQTITNYHSAHVVDNAKGVLVGRRLGNLADEKWRLIGTPNTAPLFQFLDFTQANNGISVDTKGTVALVDNLQSPPSWSLIPVDFAPPDGSYFLLNIKANLYLTPNTVSLERPVLATSTPSPWQLSTLSVGKRALQRDLFLSEPASDSIWATTAPPGEIFSITDNAGTSTALSIVRTDSKGGFNIISPSGKTLIISSVTDPDGTHIASFSDPTGGGGSHWAIIPMIQYPLTWTVPAWVQLTKSGNVPNLPDGIYRVSNRQSKAFLVLNESGRITMTTQQKEAASSQLWLITRNRSTQLPPQSQNYTVTSLASNVSLQELSFFEGQPFSGLPLCVSPTASLAARAAMQQWMIWKPTLGKQTAAAFSWVLQAVGGSGGLLDYSNVQLATVPQLEARPRASQVWQLDRLDSEISPGYYRLRNLFTQSYLTGNRTAEYSAVTSDWRIDGTNGLYTLQSLGDFLYLSGATPSMSHSSDAWLLVPGDNGSIFIQHLATRLVLTASAGKADGDLELLEGLREHIPWQRWTLERVDHPSPEFTSRGSDKVVPGAYSVINVGTSQYLAWPAPSAIGISASCLPSSSKSPPEWIILSTGTGYYSLTMSNLPLGSGGIAAVGGLDSSSWKLLKFDTGNYRIVNQATGLPLMQDQSGKVIEALDLTDSDRRDEWRLVQDTTVKVTTPQSLRELSVSNGLYNLSNSDSNALAFLNPGQLPQVVSRDLEPYSITNRCQLFIIEQYRDGWYGIKSFPFGISLAIQSQSLSFGTDDGTDNYRWKFLQDVSSSTCQIVNKSRPDLSISKDLSLSTYTNGIVTSSTSWTLIRSTGTSPDTKFPQGTYLISLFADPTIASIQSAAAAQQTAYQSDQAYANKISIIDNSLTAVSDTLWATYPNTAIPGFGMNDAETQLLAASDSKEATPVADTVAWFYTYLYNATIASQQASAITGPTGTTTSTTKDPNTGTAAGTTTGTSPAGTRTLALSDAISQVGNLLVNYCQSCLKSALDPKDIASQIRTLAVQTTLLQDITVPAIQSSALSSGRSVITKVDNLIESLAQPSPSSDPNAPLTFTQTSNTIGLSPLVQQSLTQYFLIEKSGPGADTYQISHLTSRLYLQLDTTKTPSALVLQSAPYLWKISLQRSGGYAIFSATDPNVVIGSFPRASINTLCGVTFVSDGQPGALLQRWQLRRTGYYLQNLGDGNFNRLVSASTSGQVTLVPFSLFSGATRSDTYNTWHLDKVGTTGQYRLYNEYSRTALRDGPGDKLITAPDLNITDADLWQFAKNGSDLWMQCGNPKKWLSTDGATGTAIVLNDPGNKEKWKGWQLISLPVTERGSILTLPRYILRAPTASDPTIVYQVDPTNVSGPPIQKTYQPDNSYQRWRAYTYGSNTVYLNEAVSSVLRLTGQSSVSLDVSDGAVWYTADSNGNITSTSNPGAGPIFRTPSSNTGDLSGASLSLRIQTSGPGPNTLDVDGSGNVVLNTFNRLSTTQIWSYLDWDIGRYVQHIQSGKMLGFDSSNRLTLLPQAEYNQSTLWKPDTSVALQPDLNGLYPLRPVSQPQLAVQQSLLLGSGSSSGFRFIQDSLLFHFTDRRAVLNNFLKSNAPLFLYAQGSPLPQSVDAFLSTSTLYAPPDMNIHPPYSLGLLGGTDGVLTYTGSPSPDGSTATMYITAQDASDPAYINYTDITFALLYVNGWSHTSLRYNNETKRLESVYFPTLGWIYNLDLNWSTLVSPDSNPLKIVKRTTSDNTTRLHVYVGPDGNVVPSFPSWAQNSDIIDNTKWSKVIDGSQGTLIRADFLSDDQDNSRPVPPQWATWPGKWSQGDDSHSRFNSTVM